MCHNLMHHFNFDINVVTHHIMSCTFFFYIGRGQTGVRDAATAPVRNLNSTKFYRMIGGHNILILNYDNYLVFNPIL